MSAIRGLILINFDAILNHPLGSLLSYAVELAGSYAVGIILFTLFIKIVLSPLSLITHKNTIKQMKIRPYEEILRKKYGNDRNKYNMALSSLYKEHGISVASGCLPLLVQMPILFALYKIIRMPLTYISKLSTETIAAIDSTLKLGVLATESPTAEVTIAEALFENFDLLVSQGILPSTFVPLDYNFFGINLADNPSFAINTLLFIPIFAGVTAFMQSYYQTKSQPQSDAAAATSKSLMFTMPLISVWITFSLPAGVGFYWGMSNLFTFFQLVIFNSIWSPKKALEQARIDIVENQRIAKEQKKQQANEKRIAKETENRAKGDNKGAKTKKSVTQRIYDDDLEDFQPESPVPQPRQTGKPTKGGYERVLGHTSIPDPIDDDIEPSVEQSESSQDSSKPKKKRGRVDLSNPSAKKIDDVEEMDETVDEAELEVAENTDEEEMS